MDDAMWNGAGKYWRYLILIKLSFKIYTLGAFFYIAIEISIMFRLIGFGKRKGMMHALQSTHIEG